MARLIKGSWDANVVPSPEDENRPDVIAEFSIKLKDMHLVHPTSLNVILFEGAANIGQAVCAEAIQHPYRMLVHPTVRMLDGRVTGTVRFTWHEFLSEDLDVEMASRFMNAAVGFCEHANQCDIHSTITSCTSEKEAMSFLENRQQLGVVTVRPTQVAVVTTGERTPECNTRPVHGVN